MLQTRNAKRPAQAAVRFAVDAVGEGLLTERGGARHDRRRQPRRAAAPDVRTRTPTSRCSPAASPPRRAPPRARSCSRPTTPSTGPSAGARWCSCGRSPRPTTCTASSPRRASSPPRAARPRTRRSSRAGWASRAWRARRRCGSTSRRGALRVGDTELHEGDLIAIDGSTGAGDRRRRAALRARGRPELRHRARLGRRAPPARRARERRHAGGRARAREFGAEGIGLCRTEHMFMAADRQPKMQAMIMAEDGEHRRAALAELLPLQTEDFEGLFEAMAGLPVTIRLLDPPLHEFLPNSRGPRRRARARAPRAPARRAPARAHARPRALARGDQPDARHARRAARHHRAGDLRRAGRGDRDRRARRARAHRQDAADRDHAPARRLRAGGRDPARARRARDRGDGRRGPAAADRHDDRAAARVLHRRPDRAARPTSSRSARTTSRRPRSGSRATTSSPASSPTTWSSASSTARRSRRSTSPGVGWLVRLGAWVGREAKPSLKLGICGEHGGDPDSIAFFHMAGLDYVSCSPYRVPIARVAAAQAAIREDRDQV